MGNNFSMAASATMKRFGYDAVPDISSTDYGHSDDDSVHKYGGGVAPDGSHRFRQFCCFCCCSCGAIVSLSHRNKRIAAIVLGMGLAATSVVTTWETATFLSWQTQQQRLIPAAASSHHEMIPTLFSVVDPATALPLLALDNPLYKTTLRHAIFHQSPVDVNSSNNNNNDAKLLHHFWNIVELPTLSVDVVTVDGRRSWTPTNDKPSWPGEEATSTTSLTLTWTLGKDLRGHSVIRETENDDCTVLVWSCATEQPTYDDKTRDAAATDTTTTTTATTTKPKKLQIVEAATVAQAQATSTALKSTAQHHSTTLGNTNRNEWRIPTIPSFLRRQSHCQVDMYQKIGPLEYVSLATVPIPLLGHVDTPFGIHLALTATPDRMLVQFVTGAPGTPVAQYRRQRPHHKTGYENDDDMRRVHGESTTYTAEDMCQAPANETAPGQFQPPGYLHAVALTNLEPNAVYTYQVGLETGQGVTWNSQWYGFVAALPAGDATEHSFIVYGDQGCPIAGWDEGKAWMSTMATRELGTSGSNNEITTMRSIHHFGDLSYAQGAAHHWDAWFDMIENVVAQVPLMVAVGNHEYDHEAGGDGGKDPSRVETDSGFMPPWGNFGNDSGGECGVPTSKRFTMPETGNGVYWYSYDYGLVHTIVISSEHDLSVGSPQHRWLEKDLHAADRSLTPWVVVESHRPFYEGERYWNDNTVGVAMRYEVEDLLFDYHVDLVLSGHYHAYHRTCDGLYRSKCNQGGPTHLTIGTAGAHLNEDNVGFFTNDWTANVIMQTYGYGRITIKNDTTLHFEFVKHGNETDPTAGEVLDDVWIVRDR